MKALANRVVLGLAVAMIGVFALTIVAQMVELAMNAPHFCGGGVLVGLVLLVAAKKKQTT